MKLNLGCGQDYKKGWVNVDMNKNVKADIYHNIEKFPYPFKDSTFDYLLLDMVLEHVTNPLKVIEELWRISKPKARIVVKVPHWSSYLAYSDLTHKSFFSSESFSYFEKEDCKYYSDFANFKVISKRCKSFRTNSKFWKPFEWLCKYILEPLFNAKPMVTEQILCKFLPVNEIDFELEVVKKNT